MQQIWALDRPAQHIPTTDSDGRMTSAGCPDPEMIGMGVGMRGALAAECYVYIADVYIAFCCQGYVASIHLSYSR